MHKNSIVVYYHRAGLRIRNCQSTVYPLSYDKNGNHHPGAQFAENFRQWVEEIKEANMPAEIVMSNRLEEAKKLLGNNVTVNK